MKKVSAIFTLIFIICLVFAGCSPDDGSGLDIPAVTVTGSEGVVFSNSEDIVFGGKSLSGTLTLSNTSKLSLTLKITYIADEGEKKSIRASLEGGASCDVELEGTGELFGVGVIYTDDKTQENISLNYPAHPAAFNEALSVEGEGSHIVLGFELGEEITRIERPVTLILEEDLSSDIVYCAGDFEGKIVIDEEDGDLEPKKFFAEGEGIVLDMPRLKHVEANPTYYLRVKIYNSRELENGRITLTTLDEWNDLYSEDKLPNLYKNDTLIFSGDYTLPAGITLEGEHSVSFEKGVVLEGAIKIKTSEKATLSFSADKKSTLPDYPVDLEGENVDVLWDIPRNNGVTMYDIAKHLGALTVNGKTAESYALGGDGSSKLTSVTLHATENRNITKTIVWKADGYTLRATIDCVADPYTLKDAVLQCVVTGGGSVEFDDNVKGEKGGVNLLAASGCYVTVTDKNGESVRYLIETEYVPSPLPIVVIEVEDGKDVESNEAYQNATIYMTTDGSEYESIGESSIQIRGRGHSTWKWEKKPYKIKFDKKTSLFGLEANKDWTLLANYTDKSLIRNYVAMEGAKLLSFAYTPSQFPVDVFVNGEYVGIYTMGEQLETKDGRVELTDNGSEVDTGYFLEIGGTSSEDVWNETCFYTTLCKYVKVKAPDSDTLTKDQVAYIREYVKKADEAVMKGEGYEEYIDLQALIDWVIVHELYYNIDCAFRRSCYFTKDAGGKLTMGPVWDFDNAFGNFWKDDKTYSTWATADSTTGYIWDNWMSYLITYPEFREKFRARWDEVKYELLEELLSSIDEGYDLCKRSAAYNFEVWDILDRRVGCQDSSIKKYNTYEKQIDYFRSFIKTRWKWMDENI